MEIRVERAIFALDYTMSRIYINGELFSFGLEPYDASITKEWPVEDILSTKNKYGKIAIPVGEYTLIYNWSKKYKKMLPLILDTPGFSGVRIHSGNSCEDTRSCLLIGKFHRYGYIIESRKTMDSFINLWKDENGLQPAKINYTWAANRNYLY